MGVATQVTMRVIVVIPSQGYPLPSLQARTSISARYPDWYAHLERYVSYRVDQAERAVEGIVQLER
jgi:hypothetical protein